MTGNICPLGTNAKILRGFFSVVFVLVGTLTVNTVLIPEFCCRFNIIKIHASIIDEKCK